MEWVRGQAIGHGSFATVSLAKPTTQSSSLPSLMAVKTCAVSQSASLMRERMILDELKDCPGILRCYGDCFTVENGQKLYNVTLEYASGGSLADRVKNSENLRLPESDVRRYTNSILQGIHFIHRNGFVHCDIKLQNILLFCDGGNDIVKIADFGLAKKSAEESNSKSKYELRGTPMYMAPETVTGGKQEAASDIWALGCLVLEMFTGKPAWTCSDIGPLLMKIGVGAEIPDIPGKLSEAGKDFIRKCFVKDPNQRWTAEMLLNHPFIEGQDQIPSTSPRNPFDFPDWESEKPLPVTPFCSPVFDFWIGEDACISPENRLRQLMTDEASDWSVGNSWISVR
ncbi:mitogen-activated protein kinase kinase kinase 17 [Cynara cardunculus var. scolymus]|uniref:Protein kinase, ATP binding site-containing protein n=1 Tax=Cynara cardunculus var. scolymus TaxID=59895 RepID=A0A103YH82_CYNCS|nr:mitogen-activated protein kinase kinase kinase 17 [Cynara cardunculus var. scolymus]KVI09050.1 Protein kinase, ATP binding site-containing protein [Cynara cardunculus var. scolymus]